MYYLPTFLQIPSILWPGDYWPGEAENLLQGIAEEQRQAGKRAGKGSGAKPSGPRGKASAKVPPASLSVSAVATSTGCSTQPRSAVLQHGAHVLARSAAHADFALQSYSTTSRLRDTLRRF